jgi:hypothetical protein
LIPLEDLEESPLLALMQEDVVTSHGNTTEKQIKQLASSGEWTAFKKTGILFRGSYLLYHT